MYVTFNPIRRFPTLCVPEIPIDPYKSLSTVREISKRLEPSFFRLERSCTPLHMHALCIDTTLPHLGNLASDLFYFFLWLKTFGIDRYMWDIPGANMSFFSGHRGSVSCGGWSPDGESHIIYPTLYIPHYITSRTLLFKTAPNIAI